MTNNVRNIEPVIYQSTNDNGLNEHAPKIFAEAFGLLVYPFYDTLPDYITNRPVDERCLTRALTCDANLEGTGFSLSAEAVILLASAYKAAYETLDGLREDDVRAYEILGIDIPDDIKSFYPVKEFPDPMYPDFPTQIMEISEAQFRFHQMLHYQSTYGTELLLKLLGVDAHVSEGWLPSVEATEKTETVISDDMPGPIVLNIALSKKQVKDVLVNRLSRPTRMTKDEIDCVILAFNKGWIKASDIAGKIAFKENMYDLVYTVSNATSSEIYHMLCGVCIHPTDLFKVIRYCLDKKKEEKGKAHLSTKMKKAFCRRLEDFDIDSLEQNLADAPKELTRMINYLSVNRFVKNDSVRYILDMYNKGELKSYNSKIEYLWKAFSDDPTEDNVINLLNLYKSRPGIFLRSLSRIHNNIFRLAPDYLPLIKKAWDNIVPKLSLPTLITIATLFMRTEVNQKNDYRYNHDTVFNNDEKKDYISHIGRFGKGLFDADYRLRNEKLRVFHKQLAEYYILPAIQYHLSKLDVPFDNKKVYLEFSGFSLVGSLLFPNFIGETGTYPAPGMAYDIPDKGIVRFFTFWNEQRPNRRVDIDLHFYGQDIEGNNIHIGWNGDFRNSGMATSGDITHSINAVEYLDIDMEAAKAANAKNVTQQIHIFAGAYDFADIETVYSGATLVGSTDKDVKLYDEEMVLFRNDLTDIKNLRSLNYSFINIPDHYSRILRGNKLPIEGSEFNLGVFLVMLFGEHHCQMVDNKDDADIIISIGRENDGDADVVLYDEGFYIGQK